MITATAPSDHDDYGLDYSPEDVARTAAWNALHADALEAAAAVRLPRDTAEDAANEYADTFVHYNNPPRARTWLDHADNWTHHVNSRAVAADSPSIFLEMHICHERRSYFVVWEGPNAEQMALTYLQARRSTHAVHEVEGATLPRGMFPRLIEELYPTCEHGMSADNCYGPDHFMTRDQERFGY